MKSVYCAVRTGYLNKAVCASYLKVNLSKNVCSHQQDGQGNTALHLAVCQATVPWECVLDLVERGAQISLKNRAGVRAADLAPSCLLARLQDQMLNDCWSGLCAGSSTTGTMLPQSSIGPEASGNCTASQTSVARSSNPARILRKLRTASGTSALGPLPLRTESTEEASYASAEMLALSSTGSVRSRTSRYSLETGAAIGGNNNNNNNNNRVSINTICYIS